MDSFDPVTRQGMAITNLFWLELGISAVLLLLVVGWLVTALVRFRAAPGDGAEPRQVHGNRRLEISGPPRPWSRSARVRADGADDARGRGRRRPTRCSCG